MMQVPFVKFLLAPGKSKEASESLSFGRVLSLSFRAYPSCHFERSEKSQSPLRFVRYDKHRKQKLRKVLKTYGAKRALQSIFMGVYQPKT